MPPEGIATFNFQQSPQQQAHQAQYHQVRQALLSTTSAKSTRMSTPSPTIYDIRAINNEDIREGEHPLGIGGHRRLFNVNQLKRKHLWVRDLPRGLLRRWGRLCDTGAVTSVAPRNFADHVPLQDFNITLQCDYTQPESEH